MEEGYLNLWQKTQKAFQYIWEHHREDADWFMKADDDTYVITDNLRSFLSQHDPGEPHHFGAISHVEGTNISFNFGGAGNMFLALLPVMI